jgi:hypothetical protein
MISLIIILRNEILQKEVCSELFGTLVNVFYFILFSSRKVAFGCSAQWGFLLCRVSVS